MHQTNLPEEQSLTDSESLSVEAAPVLSQSSTIGDRLPPEPLAPTLTPLPVSPHVAEGHAPQMLTVILRSCGDPGRDIRRISRLHGTFISYPGKDRFAFQIFEEGRGHLIEFPNDTTHLCDDLMTRIKDTVGEDNLRIEPILYQ